MELAFVLFFVLVGTGAIVYSALRTPPKRSGPLSGDASVAPGSSPRHDVEGGDGGADSGGGGGD